MTTRKLHQNSSPVLSSSFVLSSVLDIEQLGRQTTFLRSVMIYRNTVNAYKQRVNHKHVKAASQQRSRQSTDWSQQTRLHKKRFDLSLLQQRKISDERLTRQTNIYTWFSFFRCLLVLTCTYTIPPNTNRQRLMRGQYVNCRYLSCND